MSWIILGIIISVIVVGAIALEVVSQEEESKAKDQDQDRLRKGEEQLPPVEPTPEPETEDNFPTTYYMSNHFNFGSSNNTFGRSYSEISISNSSKYITQMLHVIIPATAKYGCIIKVGLTIVTFTLQK